MGTLGWKLLGAAGLVLLCLYTAHLFKKVAVLEQNLKACVEASESLRTARSEQLRHDVSSEQKRRSEAQETALKTQAVRNAVLAQQVARIRAGRCNPQGERIERTGEPENGLAGHSGLRIDPEFRRMFNDAVRAGNTDAPAGVH